ncbi:SdpI family protein [Peribacillus deserti]|uniref:DUF1648 domain-containing protein n=1 Tax=Peribacillus deserti TaxID=673318 RepID=A0A2N5MBV8_9BACI|nr:SdpI family protein [Peribacillus deserti]PLT31836.1 hypothetical protein CUU66_01370 [Peribacillus deserti]
MKKHILPLVLIGASIILWLVSFAQLPAEMPIHWNMSGEVDGYASRFNAMLFSIGGMILIYALLVFIPRMDPKKENYKYFSKGYSIIQISTLLLFFVINILVLSAGLGFHVNTSLVIHIAIGVLFILIGNYMPQIKPNYFTGIKTPWTLNDENNWKQTHRFGGKTFIVGGILFIASIFLPHSFAETVALPVILVIILSPIAYSYFLFRKNGINIGK